MKRSVQSLTLVGSLLVAMTSPLLADETVQSSATGSSSSHNPSSPGVYPEAMTLGQYTTRIKLIGNSKIGAPKSYAADGTSTYEKNVQNTRDALALRVDFGILDDLTASIAVPFIVNHQTKHTNSAAPKETISHTTGISDITGGFLYNAFNNGSALISAGLGFRAPVGRYSDVDSSKGILPAGEGSYVGGFRLIADYQPVTNLWLSAESTLEVGLASLKKQTQGGDIHLDQKGLTHKSFGQIAYGFGALAPSVSFLSAKARYAFEHNAEKRIRESNTVMTKASNVQKLGGGLGIDLTTMALPLTLEGLYMAPVAGVDASNESQSIEIGLSAFI